MTYSESAHSESEVRGGRTFRFHVAKDAGNQYVNGAVHPHVIDTRLVVQMLDTVGLQMIDVVLLAKRISTALVPDNAPFLERSAPAYLNSPFEVDQ